MLHPCRHRIRASPLLPIMRLQPKKRSGSQRYISDPVQAYDEFYVGSFLDSEGNKLWFCSPV